MAIELTRVSARALYGLPGETVADTIAVADDAVSDALVGGIYRVKATTACTVRIGPGLTDASDGESWAANAVEYRSINEGSVAACDAAA